MLVDWLKRFQEIEPYYEKGMNDREIEKETGISHKVIWKIRKKNNKPANGELFGANAFTEVSEDNGFDGDWSHGWLKSKDEKGNKVSLFIRNKEDLESKFDELVEHLKEYSPSFPKIKYDSLKEGHLLVIDPADVHIGKLSYTEETNDSYNTDVAIERCLEGVRGILTKSKGFGVDRILLIVGNDILHYDTPRGTTTKGTPLDHDSAWWKVFTSARDLYINVIELLSMVAPLDIVYNPSNHDYMMGFSLVKVLEAYFRKHEGVTFDADIIHRKYYQYGKNMIGSSHGDGAKEKDVPLLMAHEAPHIWADTTHRYLYLHHIHHKKKISYQSGKDYIGVSVEYLRSPSPSDSWHFINGYIAPKAIEGFIHHKENGQIARLTNYFS